MQLKGVAPRPGSGADLANSLDLCNCIDLPERSIREWVHLLGFSSVKGFPHQGKPRTCQHGRAAATVAAAAAKRGNAAAAATDTWTSEARTGPARYAGRAAFAGGAQGQEVDEDAAASDVPQTRGRQTGLAIAFDAWDDQRQHHPVACVAADAKGTRI